MPFVVFKTVRGWKIRKPGNNKTYPTTYKTKQSAVSTAKNWLRYRGEPSSLVKVQK